MAEAASLGRMGRLQEPEQCLGQGTTDTPETAPPAFQRQVNFLEHIFSASSAKYKNGKENAKILQCVGNKGWETDLKQGSNLDICTTNVFLLLNMCVSHVCIHMYTYMYLHSHVWVYVPICVHMHLCLYDHYMRACICICMCICTYALE